MYPQGRGLIADEAPQGLGRAGKGHGPLEPVPAAPDLAHGRVVELLPDLLVPELIEVVPVMQLQVLLQAHSERGSDWGAGEKARVLHPVRAHFDLGVTQLLEGVAGFPQL